MSVKDSVIVMLFGSNEKFKKVAREYRIVFRKVRLASFVYPHMNKVTKYQTKILQAQAKYIQKYRKYVMNDLDLIEEVNNDDVYRDDLLEKAVKEAILITEIVDAKQNVIKPIEAHYNKVVNREYINDLIQFCRESVKKKEETQDVSK